MAAVWTVEYIRIHTFCIRMYRVGSLGTLSGLEYTDCTFALDFIQLLIFADPPGLIGVTRHLGYDVYG